MSEKFQVTRLDEMPPAQGADDSRWFRLRRDLDVGAFGVNAYGADAGKRVIEEHDELGTAAAKHEELYVVLRGAVAEEDGTVVLVVGGTPDVAYSVAPWEAATDAYPHWRKGDYGTAVEILRSVVEEHPDAGIVLYNLACAETLLGEHDAALGHLARAIELEERFREFAKTDEDFDAVRKRDDFRELIEAAE